MTPDERNLLQHFLGDLEGARGPAKDADADGMVSEALRANPDAAYLLVQHAILADQALQAAQQQIEALQAQQQSQPPARGSSFPGAGQPPAPQGYGQQEGYPPPGGWNDQQAPRPQSPLSQHSGLGSFLRSAGTVAAGMAGGEFLAQGLSNLFSPRDW